MGCQTTDTTPKDTISPEKVVKQKKKEVPPQIELTNPVIVHKPLLCGDSGAILEGIVKTHNERPVSWFVSKQTGIGNSMSPRRTVKAPHILRVPTLSRVPTPEKLRTSREIQGIRKPIRRYLLSASRAHDSLWQVAVQPSSSATKIRGSVHRSTSLIAFIHGRSL